jgi:membrane fusion protein, multidrug efflux system
MMKSILNTILKKYISVFGNYDQKMHASIGLLLTKPGAYKRPGLQTVLGLFLLIMPLLFVGCSGQAEESPDAIRQQISTYQVQINELTIEINELEKLLEDMGERPRSRNQIPVSINELTGIDFKQFFTATASVEAVQAAIISPETNGQLKEVLVNKGQRVTAGQVVAKLNTNVISGNISEVETNLELAKTVYQRQKKLWEQQIGSEIQFLEARNKVESLETRLKTLKAQMDMAIMRAPFDGIVDDIFIKVGELAMPGSRIMLILNLSKLYINADVSETHLQNVSKGDSVILRFPSFPDYEVTQPVHRVGNTINPENRTFRVQLQIDNSDERFKPNMMASMSINTLTIKNAITVPSILIKQDLQGHYVYLAKSENDELLARKTYIDRGPDGEGITMVIEGLQEGDTLIHRGHNQVTGNSLIRIEDGLLTLTHGN